MLLFTVCLLFPGAVLTQCLTLKKKLKCSLITHIKPKWGTVVLDLQLKGLLIAPWNQVAEPPRHRPL